MAAESGCRRSCEAAATKRVREALARSAEASAASSSVVREATRASSRSLASERARAASRSGVTSVTESTKPPSGVSAAKTSSQRPAPPGPPACRSARNGARPGSPSRQARSCEARFAPVRGPAQVVEHHVEGVARPEPRQRDGEQRGEAAVDGRHAPVGADDADSLAQVLERGADQPRLVVHDLVVLLALEPQDAGDVGLHDHRLPARHAVLADLDPALAGHADVEHHVRLAVPRHPRRRPGLGRLALGSVEVGRAGDQRHVVGEGEARHEPVPDVGQVGGEARVAEHQPVVLVEEREALLDGLDGPGEVRARPLGLAAGAGEAGVGVVEKAQRLLEVAGPLAHLVLEQDRALELAVGAAGALASPAPSTRRIRAAQMRTSFSFCRSTGSAGSIRACTSAIIPDRPLAGRGPGRRPALRARRGRRRSGSG